MPPSLSGTKSYTRMVDLILCYSLFIKTPLCGNLFVNPEPKLPGALVDIEDISRATEDSNL